MDTMVESLIGLMVPKCVAGGGEIRGIVQGDAMLDGKICLEHQRLPPCETAGKIRRLVERNMAAVLRGTSTDMQLADVVIRGVRPQGLLQRVDSRLGARRRRGAGGRRQAFRAESVGGDGIEDAIGAADTP